MKDDGAEVNCTNDFTDEGTGYSLVITATEAQAARISLYIIDQTATKVWLDKALIVETYGNASAQHAVDLDDSVRAGLTVRESCMWISMVSASIHRMPVL